MTDAELKEMQEALSRTVKRLDGTRVEAVEVEPRKPEHPIRLRLEGGQSVVVEGPDPIESWRMLEMMAVMGMFDKIVPWKKV
jgi:hypothetical protein